MNNENNSNNIWAEIFGKQEEERRIKEAEREIHYTERKKEKHLHRQCIEDSVEKICAMIDKESKKSEHSPNDIALLAAALSHVATAMHAAENYAEYVPHTSFSLGSCAV